MLGEADDLCHLSSAAGDLAVQVRDGSILVQYNMDVAMMARTTQRSWVLACDTLPSASERDKLRTAQRLDYIKRTRHDIFGVADALLGYKDSYDHFRASHASRVHVIDDGYVHGFVAKVEGDTRDINTCPRVMREAVLAHDAESLFLDDILVHVLVEDVRASRAPTAKRARMVGPPIVS